jgi:hypothetical protein
VHEAQQQPKGIAVGGDGVRADASLGEAFGEESLQGGGDPGHRSSRPACPTRPAASASNSGVAVRYQLFRYRNNWYLHAAPELMSLAAERLAIHDAEGNR